MAFTILYPPAGSFNDPIKLARQFVAFGTKDTDDERALGVLLSLDQNDQPDGKYRIGGSTIVYRPDGNGNPQDRRRWAIHFRVPARIGRRQKFALVVFNSEHLPGSVVAQNNLPKCYVKFKKRSGGPPGGGGGGPGGSSAEENFLVRASVDEPRTGQPAPRADFVAYGLLPPGEYDVDVGAGETRLEDSNNAAITVDPYWGWTDGSGFWVQFFNPVPPNTNNVKLTVVYLPYASEEDVPDISIP